MAAVGLIQPIVVKEAASGFEVVAGHRRLLACRLVGLAQVPIIVRSDDAATSAEVMLAENLQRVDLNPVEEARALQRGRDELGLSIEDLAKRAKRSDAWVRGRLDLLLWPSFVLEALVSGSANVTALRPLMEIENQVERNRLLECAISAGATAQVTRTWAAQAQGMASTSPETMGANARTMLPIGDVVVSMPCWSCKQPKPALSLDVVRICRPCVQDVERAAAAATSDVERPEPGNGSPATGM